MFYILAGIIAIAFIVMMFSLTEQIIGNRSAARSIELKSARKKLSAAERSLRRIASGTTGNPTLEAAAALDEIETLEIKKLS